MVLGEVGANLGWVVAVIGDPGQVGRGRGDGGAEGRGQGLQGGGQVLGDDRVGAGPGRGGAVAPVVQAVRAPAATPGPGRVAR